MAATRTAPACAQARLNRMVGRPSGFIETLPRAVRGRIEYLRSLQEKHDDLEEEYNTELRALEAKYEALYGALRRRRLLRCGRPQVFAFLLFRCAMSRRMAGPAWQPGAKRGAVCVI